MSRSPLCVAALVGGSLASFAFAGCGGKAKSEGDHEPPPAVAANTTPNHKSVPPAPKGEPKSPGLGIQTGPSPTPKSDAPGFGPLSPLPGVPMPLLPVPKDPQAPSPSPKNPSPFVPPPVPDKPKDPEPPKKDPEKAFEWPTQYLGRPMSEYIKEISDSDPVIREMALRALPNFGPNAREPATKVVLRHMDFVFERDPGVRAAAFEAIAALSRYNKSGEFGLESDADTKEAIRLLATAADRGGATRLHAIQTLASFGQKAESAVQFLVGQNMTVLEPAYQTRAAIATTLGAIGYEKDKGPNHQVLQCLVNVLIKDPSAAVRLAAYQSIVILGPPMMAAPAKAGGGKATLKVDDKAVAALLKTIRSRLLPFKAEPGAKEKDSPTGLMERNEQVEIYARFTLMRFDNKEGLDENLTGIAKYLKNGNSGVKNQALTALGIMGEFASRKISDVVAVLEDEDPNVVQMAVSVLVAMGPEAKPAIEALNKLKTRGSKKDEKNPKDLPVEYYDKLATQAIKAIMEAKPAAAAKN
jgi:HEAT repeat protein